MQHWDIQGDVDFYSLVQSGKHRVAQIYIKPPLNNSLSTLLKCSGLLLHFLLSAPVKKVFWCILCLVLGINNLTRRSLIKIWGINSVFLEILPSWYMNSFRYCILLTQASSFLSVEAQVLPLFLYFYLHNDYDTNNRLIRFFFFFFFFNWWCHKQWPFCYSGGSD